MKKSKENKTTEGIGAEGFIIILTALTTVVTSVMSQILSEQSLGYSISVRVLYISLSCLLVELLYEVFQLKKSSNEIASAIHLSEDVVFPKENAKLEKHIENALANPKARKILIICYGTSKYGRVIETLMNNYEYVQGDVVVCSPDITILNYRWDKDKLKNVIEDIAKAPNITVYMSRIPPTIRGSLITTKDGLPLFCTMQSYFIFTDSKHALFRGKGIAPAIVAQDESSPILFDLTSIFENEFMRLKNSSTKYAPSTSS